MAPICFAIRLRHARCVPFHRRFAIHCAAGGDACRSPANAHRRGSAWLLSALGPELEFGQDDRAFSADQGGHDVGFHVACVPAKSYYHAFGLITKVDIGEIAPNIESP
jgi:hypothetical protein